MNNSTRNKFNIDNDNLITEDEVKELKFEYFGIEKNQNISKKQKENGQDKMDISENDLDMFYEMEMEEEKEKNRLLNNIQKNNDSDILDVKSDLGIDKSTNILGKRTHSDAFNIINHDSNEFDSVNNNPLSSKIRKIDN